MTILVFVVGLAVVALTTSSVVGTVVVPRGSRSRFVRLASALARTPLRMLADRSARVERADAVLAWTAPLGILFSLVGWLGCFLAGYGLMLYGLGGLDLPASLREAGSSLFTLGFASTDRGQLTVVDFAAAATGPLVVALQIGYLPALYASYNRRETEVTLLRSRAGEPNWGPEILVRHMTANTLDRLDELFRGWERWAADVSESHTNYPVLIHFRSPDPYRNWLVALVSVMDAGALQLALNPSQPQGGARLSVRAGFVCLRELAEVEGIPFDNDPSPDSEIQLSYQEFLAAVERLRSLGYPMERTPEAAWTHFRGWRVNYESLAYEMCRRIDAVPAPWTGPRRVDRGPVAPHTPADRQPGGGIGRPRPGN